MRARLKACRSYPTNVRWLLPLAVGGLVLVWGATESWAQCVINEAVELHAPDGDIFDQFGSSVALSGEVAVIGAALDDDNGADSGAAHVFRMDPDAPGGWIAEAKLLAADGAAFDHFGASVSVSGDVAVVGAPNAAGEIHDSGSAYIFRADPDIPGEWIAEAKLLAAGGAAGDNFGHSVSVHGDVAVLGAPNAAGETNFSGAAYVYRYDPKSKERWTAEAKLQAGDGAPGDEFGYSVSVDGDVIVVGAVSDDENGTLSGSVYIFRRRGDAWMEEAKLLASEGMEFDDFGSSVSIAGDLILVGATGADGHTHNSGVAYMYRFDPARPGLWTEEAKLAASDGVQFDSFGASVSVSGDVAVVCAPFADGVASFSGVAYFYRFDPTAPEPWIQEAKLQASHGGILDHLGESVSITGDVALIGARLDDDLGMFSGSAYIFAIGAVGTPPQNDMCEDATPIPTGVVSGTTCAATTDGSAACDSSNGGSDVWYTYTASCSGWATADTCLSSFDTVLSVHTAECPASPASEIACDNDGCDQQSNLTWAVDRGVTYLIRVAGVADAFGDFDLNVTCGELLTCQTRALCDADVNGDGVLDPLDTGAIQARFGLDPCNEETCQYDVNCDAVIDPLDTGYVLARFGTCDPPVACPICSHDVINDNCEDAPIDTLYGGGPPLTYKGDNTYATMTCASLGFEETWHAVDLDSDDGMTTSLCGTYPPFGNAFIVIDQSCPCSGNFIFANLFDQTTCDDGNWAMHYDSLPSGVYFTPVLKDDTSTGPYTWNISPFGSPPPQACGPGTGNCCQEGGNGSPSCDDEDCCNAICAADPFCCDTEWDDICADQAQDECDICNFVCKFDENCDDDDVCTDDICNEAGQCVNPDNGTCQCGGSEAGDCCEEGGNGGPFCNDFICCNMVCDNDSFCCETQWDDLCADQACELCDICRCSE